MGCVRVYECVPVHAWLCGRARARACVKCACGFRARVCLAVSRPPSHARSRSTQTRSRASPHSAPWRSWCTLSRRLRTRCRSAVHALCHSAGARSVVPVVGVAGRHGARRTAKRCRRFGGFRSCKHSTRRSSRRAEVNGRCGAARSPAVPSGARRARLAGCLGMEGVVLSTFLRA